jgi:hypothetical protein
VKERSGNFSSKEKEKMLISHPTRLGLRLTGLFSKLSLEHCVSSRLSA